MVHYQKIQSQNNMTVEFLVQLKVRKILFRLAGGDRFERDLACLFEDIDSFRNARNLLLEAGIVYQFSGENNSPYLSLTDKGISVVKRLDELERILTGEDMDAK